MLEENSSILPGVKKRRSDLFHFQEFSRDRANVLTRWRQRRPDARTAGVDAQSGDAENSQVIAEIRKIYELYNPEGICKVPALLERYKGEELRLLKKLQEKYVSADKPAVVKNEAIVGTRVFMSFSINGSAPRPVHFRLYDSVVPLTCENFKSLCSGDKVLDCFLLCTYVLT